MSDHPLFQNTDDQERIYAPEQLPADQRDRVRADEKSDTARSYTDNEAPAAAPVANIGNSATGSAAPPNIGHEEHGGASGDPETQAGYPLDDSDTSADHRR